MRGAQNSREFSRFFGYCFLFFFLPLPPLRAGAGRVGLRDLASLARPRRVGGSSPASPVVVTVCVIPRPGPWVAPAAASAARGLLEGLEGALWELGPPRCGRENFPTPHPRNKGPIGV